MPWNKVELMSQRKELIEKLLLPGANISSICQQAGISRKTAYKWLKRYTPEDLSSLQDQSRARHKQSHKTKDKIEQKIIKAHEEYPYWGPRKLRDLFINEGKIKDIPSVTTFARILSRNNCTVIKNNKSAPANTRFERDEPNDLWQMDFKGSFMLDTHRCYPLTILDDHSRFSIGLEACRNEKSETVKEHLTKCFKLYGLPNQINVDNGNPWGSSDLESYTKLAVWLIKQDVRLTHSAPYHPQTNGKDERFHRTLKLEVLHQRKYKNSRDIQKAFSNWRHIYNYVRPHNALGGKPPYSRYKASGREYSDIPRRYVYDEGEIVRKVRGPAGIFSFKGQVYKASKALCGEYVAIKETANENVYCIFFMDTLIKRFEIRV